MVQRTDGTKSVTTPGNRCRRKAATDGGRPGRMPGSRADTSQGRLPATVDIVQQSEVIVRGRRQSCQMLRPGAPFLQHRVGTA
jgi:hypothetical protein